MRRVAIHPPSQCGVQLDGEEGRSVAPVLEHRLAPVREPVDATERVWTES
jgi:hypothetical protein